MSSKRKLRLQSTDGEIFEVEKSVLRHEMQAVLKAIRLAGMESPIPMPKASGVVLEYILNYCKYHSESHTQQSSNGTLNPVSKDANEQWDAAFMKVEDAMLVDILVAAKYLGMENLSKLTLRTFVQICVERTPNEIEEILNLLINALVEHMD